MYYKIIYNNKIIDANSVFFRWDDKYRIMMRSDYEQAQYVQASDGNTFYTVKYLNAIPDGAPQFPIVEIEIIDYKEFAELKQLLEAQEIFIETTDSNPEEEFVEQETPPPPTLVSIPDLVSYIQTFERKYANLVKQKNLLEECILELSQELYK